MMALFKKVLEFLVELFKGLGKALPEPVSSGAYDFLYDGGEQAEKLKNATLNKSGEALVLSTCKAIVKNKLRYEAIAKSVGCPWWLVGVIHFRESSLSFAGVLHNGEKIIGTGKKTTLVPAGRGPFSSFEASAVDALESHGAKGATDWTLSQCLEFIERYNGLGYRKRGINSPYVWGLTSQYKSGRYVADGKFDPKSVDKRPGCAALLLGFQKLKVWCAPIMGESVAPPAVGPTPWMDLLKNNIGASEVPGARANALIVSMFKYTSYKTDSDETPWCAACVNWALRVTGYKGTNSAAAKSFDDYGTACEPKYGAVITIRHPGGGRHVTFFDHWVDEAGKIAACLGGNQSNKLKISNYNLSGGEHSALVASRWPVKA